MSEAFEQQVGGDHYTKLKYQPLEITLANLGYEAFRGACLTKVLKYTMREKDDYLEQLEKAADVLNKLIEVTRQEKRNEAHPST